MTALSLPGDFNEHDGTHYRRPDDARVTAFVEELAATGAKTSLRQTRGDDVYAACGQLGATSEKSPARESRVRANARPPSA